MMVMMLMTVMMHGDDFGDSDDNGDSAILVPLQQCIGQDISRKQPNAQHTNCLILKDDNDDDIGHDGDYFNCYVCVEIMRIIIIIIDDNGVAADDAEGGDDQNFILFSSHNISFVPAFLNAMHNVILFPSEPFV